MTNEDFYRFLDENIGEIVFLEIGAVMNAHYYLDQIHEEFCGANAEWIDARATTPRDRLVLNIPIANVTDQEMAPVISQHLYGSFSGSYEHLAANFGSSKVSNLDFRICAQEYAAIETGEQYSAKSGGTGILIHRFRGFYRVSEEVAYNSLYYALVEIEVGERYWASIPR